AAEGAFVELLLEAGGPDFRGRARAVGQEILQELAGAEARAQDFLGRLGHQLLGTMRTGAQPADRWVAALVRHNFVKQAWLEWGVVVLDLGQNAAFARVWLAAGDEQRNGFLFWFQANEPGGTTLGHQADGAAAAVHRAAADFLVEVPDEDDDALV